MPEPVKRSSVDSSSVERDLTAVEHRTDNQLATWFIDHHLKRVRFVDSWDEWLVWGGKRWERDPSETAIMGYARKFSKRLWQDMQVVPSSHAKDAANFCARANNTSGIKSYLYQAKSDERIAIHHDKLDSHDYVLNLPSGTLDLKTGDHYAHRPSDFLTKLAAVNFCENAKCPKWLEALNTIFAGNKELIRYVQQLLGYGMTGDTGEHILIVAYGTGCNGKSTIMNVILNLLGEYAAPAIESLLIGQKHEHLCHIAMLYGLRLVTVSETSKDAPLREARVKELTGDEYITARRMRENPWKFRRTHTFWMSTNHLPKVNGNDEGIWRRIKVIPFLTDIREVTTPNTELVQQLVKDEGPGILNWLLNGVKDYLQNGFQEPDCVKLATDNYRAEEDEVGRFIDDECTIGNYQQCLAGELYSRYEAWGGELSQTGFGGDMGNRGYKKQRQTAGKHRNKYMYYGLSLASNSPDSEGVPD
jgi:putative DNA primase/helicase